MAAERGRTPRAPAAPPPPQAVMGLLNYVTATSLDEDYAHVSQRRAAGAAPSRARRPGTWALVVLAVFGVLVATAAVQTSRGAAESASSRESLVRQVNARKAQLATARERLSTLNGQVDALQNSDLDATTAGRAARARLDRLGVITGAAATTGPGIRVVVDDAPGADQDKEMVLDQDLQRLVNSLWAIGAEAVAINGQRITSLTAIREGGDAITVNFRSLNRPYTVSAIGNEKKMAAQLLDTEGGRTFLTLRASYGLRFDVKNEDSMKLPAAPRITLLHAHLRERLK